MIINIETAISQGMTGSQLRAIANSLERIARKGYGENTRAYNRRAAFENARSLRALSKQVDRVNRGK